MIEEKDSELLKAEVKDYWNDNPCGTQFTGLQWGSREFFDEVERFRYDVQPFMADVMEFNKHKGERLLEIGCGLGTDLLQFARGERSSRAWISLKRASISFASVLQSTM